jgi:hypothetical protein
MLFTWSHFGEHDHCNVDVWSTCAFKIQRFKEKYQSPVPRRRRERAIEMFEEWGPSQIRESVGGMGSWGEVASDGALVYRPN